MRRRTDSVVAGVPSLLVTFDPEDWSRDDRRPDEEQAFAAWRQWVAAREAWAEVHGWPGGDLVLRQGGDDALRAIPDPPFNPSTV